jgi:K+-transporting ATPase ATPase C chain
MCEIFIIQCSVPAIEKSGRKAVEYAALQTLRDIRHRTAPGEAFGLRAYSAALFTSRPTGVAWYSSIFMRVFLRAIGFSPSSLLKFMKNLLSELRSALAVTLIMAVVCCGLYPLVVFGIAQTLFHDKANGSLIVDASGTNVLGSKLLGQGFTADKYFHPRPSAAGNGYDASNSGGSNLGPTSQKLRDSIAQNVADYRTQNGLATNALVPADAVTASGSGLDPHISLQNAELQVARVAKARGLELEKVRALIAGNTDSAGLGFLGGAGVNVLPLNLALDAAASTPTPNQPAGAK